MTFKPFIPTRVRPRFSRRMHRCMRPKGWRRARRPICDHLKEVIIRVPELRMDRRHAVHLVASSAQRISGAVAVVLDFSAENYLCHQFHRAFSRRRAIAAAFKSLRPSRFFGCAVSRIVGDRTSCSCAASVILGDSSTRACAASAFCFSRRRSILSWHAFAAAAASAASSAVTNKPVGSPGEIDALGALRRVFKIPL
jgi:hypothetical protein